MKKMISLLLCLMLLCVCTACSVAEDTPAATEAPASAEASGAAEAGSNILVVYFAVAENSETDAVSSASVVTLNDTPTGKVAVLANAIQQKTGADLFSIDTESVYPSNIMDLLDFAQEEQDDNARPVILNTIETIDQYDTIFVGYPLWWYDLPQVIYTFFDAYDLSGKTIIPFCTHNGSRFSGTIGTIEDLEPDATVIRDGYTVSEWDVAEAPAAIEAWLTKLGY